MGIFLFIIAFILGSIFMALGMLYSIIRVWIRQTRKDGYKSFNDYFTRMARSIDQMGNVACQHLFNDILIKKGGYRFGNEDETISSVLGKNQLTNTLTWLGRRLNGLLHWMDRNHSINSIEADEMNS
jgi:hypothetical protein